MGILGIKVDIDGPRAGFEKLRDEQLPFTIARALTMTAQDAQAATRKLVGQVFKIRNDWTVRNIKIKPAQTSRGWLSQRMVAEVYTDTENRTTGAPDYLGDQETGGERIPFGGRQHRAVPTNYLRQMVGGSVIPDELRPKAMLQYAENGGRRITRRGGLRGQSAAIRGMVFFIAPLPSGSPAIYGRYVTEHHAYPMYVLIPEALLRPIFPMGETVTEVAEANFPENFSKAATETIANDLLRGSGLRVKL